MMKKTIMILAAATISFAACQKSTPKTETVSEGTIDLSLSSDVEFVTKAAAPITVEQKRTYKITITDTKGAVTTYGPETIEKYETDKPTFPASTYTVKVENITEAESEKNPTGDATFGQAWINGSNTVEVKADSNPVTVDCTPKNAKVTLAKNDKFDQIFTKATVTLSCNGDKTPSRNITYPLTETAHTSAKAAFFTPGTLTCSISATTNATHGSATKTFGGTFTLTAAQWSKITLNANDEGSLSLTINIDTTYGEKEESLPLNPYK